MPPESIDKAKARRDKKISEAHVEYTNMLRRRIKDKGHVAVANELGVTRQSLYETLKRYPAQPHQHEPQPQEA